MRKIVVVIPEYKPGEKFIEVVESLKALCDRVEKIVCVKNGSSAEFDSVFETARIKTLFARCFLTR